MPFGITGTTAAHSVLETEDVTAMTTAVPVSGNG